MGDRLCIRCVIVDDIHFMPKTDEATTIDMRLMDEVVDLVEAVRVEGPVLQQYGLSSFCVLKILRPVQTVAAGVEEWSSRLRRKGPPLSLNPILQRLRQRTAEAKKTELANEFVKVLGHEYNLKDYFKDEDKKLISAIVVRLATPGESSLAVPHIPFDTI